MVQFLAVEVKELAAFFALKVETGFARGMTVLPYVFKAGGAASVDYVFIDDPFVHQTFKSAVYRGLRDVGSAGSEMLADVAGSYVIAFHGLEIVDQNISLGSFVF